MSNGIKGYSRRPRATDARERRNADTFAQGTLFVGSGEVVQVNGEGELTVLLLSDGGLQNANGELSLLLASEPGLQLSASGLEALLQGVLSKDASGIQVNIGAGLQDDGGSLAIDPSGIVYPVRSVASSGSLLPTDEFVLASAASGNVTLTLPTATSGRKLTVKRTDSVGTNDVTLVGTIDGNTNAELAPGDAADLIADGSGWRIV